MKPVEISTPSSIRRRDCQSRCSISSTRFKENLLQQNEMIRFNRLEQTEKKYILDEFLGSFDNGVQLLLSSTGLWQHLRKDTYILKRFNLSMRTSNNRSFPAYMEVRMHRSLCNRQALTSLRACP